MTLKEYYNHIKQAADAAGGDEIIDAIYKAPNKAWINGYKEVNPIKERITTFTYLDDMRPEELAYYFNDKTATLEDIKKERIALVKSKIPEGKMTLEEIDAWTENEHSAGYAGYEELQEILANWENMTEENLWNLMRGDDDDVPMHGHRCYLLSGELFYAMLYNFWFYGRKTPEDLEDDVYNSNDVEETLTCFKFEDVSDITSDMLKSAADAAIKMGREVIREDFNRDIDNLVRRYKDEPGMRKLVEEIESKKLLATS